MMAWVNNTMPSSQSAPFIFNLPCSTSDVIMLIKQGSQHPHPGAATAMIRQANESNGSIAYGSTLVNDGKWHMLLATRDVGSTAFLLYVDGTLDGQATLIDPGALGAPSPFYFGASQSCQGGWSYYTGQLDAVRFYQRTLPANEVAQLYAAMKPMFQ